MLLIGGGRSQKISEIVPSFFFQLTLCQLFKFFKNFR